MAEASGVNNDDENKNPALPKQENSILNVKTSDGISVDAHLLHDADSASIHWVDVHPECAVCLQLALQPVQLPCSHIFCFLCVKGFAYRSRRCALCRGEVSLEYFEHPTVVKVKEEVKTSTTESEKLPPIDYYDWFYEGQNGWWQYDERASLILEEAFKSETRSCELLIAGFLYLVDFHNMVQFRKSKPARCRRVKRDKANVERKGIAGLKLKSASHDKCHKCGEHKDLGKLSEKLCSRCLNVETSVQKTESIETEDNSGIRSTDYIESNNVTENRSSSESIVQDIQERLDRLLSRSDDE